ncbi:probable membrane-associated kinase regulator 6 [Durio zibethinus]|uniref:Probable membrane-associated kinase regulator 6 n=1 Tax=Durio zibethinus TaxID=66656 RepID=A0A6P6A3J7_DURZI|nr:probable membrane-associated kinase regulator 6 [Durio zibethinus]
METSQPLAIESFSYSWLSDYQPSLDGLNEPPRASVDNCYGGTSEEFNYEMVESNRFPTDQNFNFDAIAQTPAAFIHADELFTDGFIRPIYIDSSKRESCNALDSIQTTLRSSFSSRTEIPTGRIHCSFLRKWRKSTLQILQNLFGHLRPFCHKVRCLRKSTRVDDTDRRTWKVKGWNGSPQATPQQITACSMGDSCHLDNSIYEAVLHCKRSIEK